MQITIFVVVGLAALIAASTAFSPQATTVASEVFVTVDPIDILELTRNAKDLPVEEYEAI